MILEAIRVIFLALYLIIVGAIKLIMVLWEICGDLATWLKTRQLAETTGAVYASTTTMNQTETVILLLVIATVLCVGFLLTHSYPRSPKEFLTQYECPDKHEGVFTSQKNPKCKVCGKKMEEVKK